MDKQNTRANEQQKGPEATRGSESRNRGVSHPGSYRGFGISPADFFSLGPFSLMRRMNEEMARMFGEFGEGGQTPQRAWAPAIEIQQDDGRMKIRAELPGTNPDDVKIEMTDDAVIIQGERREEREEKQGGMHVSERRYGQFYRAVPLPEGAKSDGVKAQFNNGLLEIEVPVEQQKSSRRQIPIQSASSSQSNQPSSSNKAA